MRNVSTRKMDCENLENFRIASGEDSELENRPLAFSELAFRLAAKVNNRFVEQIADLLLIGLELTEASLPSIINLLPSAPEIKISLRRAFSDRSCLQLFVLDVNQAARFRKHFLFAFD